MELNYFENLNINFKKAIELFENDQSHAQLIKNLTSGNIVERQISAIKLQNIESQKDADILTSNLTGVDGKIREVVSFKIAQFTKSLTTLQYFMTFSIYDKLLDALTDINGNICRNTLITLNNLSDCEDFCNYFIPKLLIQTQNLCDKVLTLGSQDGKYKINKDSFKLYWCLEAINIFFYKMDEQDLVKILINAKNIEDYTIREKVAKILTNKFFSSELGEIKSELKNDKNYYVKRY